MEIRNVFYLFVRKKVEILFLKKKTKKNSCETIKWPPRLLQSNESLSLERKYIFLIRENIFDFFFLFDCLRDCCCLRYRSCEKNKFFFSMTAEKKKSRKLLLSALVRVYFAVLLPLELESIDVDDSQQVWKVNWKWNLNTFLIFMTCSIFLRWVFCSWKFSFSLNTFFFFSINMNFHLWTQKKIFNFLIFLCVIITSFKLSKIFFSILYHMFWITRLENSTVSELCERKIFASTSCRIL